jgi:hypothetical protein
VPVALVVGRAIVAVHDAERAGCRMIATLQLVDDQTKKNLGFHTGLVKMYENEHQPPEKGEKMHFVLISRVWLRNFCHDGK